MVLVSIHASAREATQGFEAGPLFGLFQSTPPRGRRLAIVLIIVGLLFLFQSTPPRGRRPQRNPCQSLRQFQSTPPRGRRLQLERRWNNHQLFQSTPPGGRRLVAASHNGRPLLVFQSTPPGEATCVSLILRSVAFGFNPRLRGGGDSAAAPSDDFNITFQSTPPGGRRLGVVDIFAIILVVSIHASGGEATRPAK